MDWRINYFREASGGSPVESFIDALSTDERVDTMVGIDMLRSYGVSLGRPWVAPLGQGLWELNQELDGSFAFCIFSLRRKPLSCYTPL